MVEIVPCPRCLGSGYLYDMLDDQQERCDNCEGLGTVETEYQDDIVCG